MTPWHYAGLAVAALVGGWLALRTRETSTSATAPAGPHGAPVAKVTPEMTAWAVQLLNDPSFPLGATAARDFEGVSIVAKAETHTWYGADPTKAATPHKGISLYYA